MIDRNFQIDNSIHDATHSIFFQTNETIELQQKRTIYKHCEIEWHHTKPFTADAKYKILSCFANAKAYRSAYCPLTKFFSVNHLA